MLDITKQQWESFKSDTEDGKVICVVGTQIDTILLKNSNKRVSLYSLLARHMCQSIDKNRTEYKDHFYAAQSLYLHEKRNNKGVSKTFLQKQFTNNIYNFLSDRASKAIDSPLYKGIAKLNVPIYINLAYDDILFEAIKKHSKRNPILVQPGDQTLKGHELNVDNPLVFNLFGVMPVYSKTTLDLKNNQLVLLEKTLFSYFSNIKSKGFIPKIIDDKNKEFPAIFIGLGWGKWYIRMLMSLYNSAGNTDRGVSIAVEHSYFFSSKNNNKEEKSSLLSLWDDIEWKIEEADETQLLKRINELACYRANSIPRISKHSIEKDKNNRIFVSFQSEALDKAKGYCRKLTEKGFEVVADKRLESSGGIQEIIHNWIADAKTSISTCYAFIAIVSDKYNDLSNARGPTPVQKELAIALSIADVTHRPFIYVCGVDANQRLKIEDNRPDSKKITQINVVNLDDNAETEKHIDRLINDVNKWS